MERMRCCPRGAAAAITLGEVTYSRVAGTACAGRAAWQDIWQQDPPCGPALPPASSQWLDLCAAAWPAAWSCECCSALALPA